MFLLLIIINCSTKKNVTPDFTFSVKMIAEDNVEMGEFYYNSNTGELKNNRPEKKVIKLNDIEKSQIYLFYQKLELASNKCWYDNKDYMDSNYTSKYDFQFKNVRFKKGQCDSLDSEEKKRYGSLYLKIYGTLQKKDEYKKEFPEEFWTY